MSLSTVQRGALIVAVVCATGVVAHPLGAATPRRIYTIAGGGSEHIRNGALASEIRLNDVSSVAFAPGSGVLFSDDERVLLLGSNGRVRVVAGGGHGDPTQATGRPATTVGLSFVRGVGPTADGGFVVVDNNTVLHVAADGTVSSTASFDIESPAGVAVSPAGEVLIADRDARSIVRVSADGSSTIAAGGGQASGDGGPATGAALAGPADVAWMADGGFLIADAGGSRVRRVTPDGTITTVAGTGRIGYRGDGGPATRAELYNPFAVAAMPDGGFLFADSGNDRIRRVAPDGVITTVAGGSGDLRNGQRATAGRVDPDDLAAAPDGGILLADYAHVGYVTASPGGVLAIAPQSARVRAGRASLSLPFTATKDASVTLTVKRGRHTVARGRARATAGPGVVSIRRRLEPRPYTLVLDAHATGGEVASEQHKRFLGGRLTDRWARYFLGTDSSARFVPASAEVPAVAADNSDDFTRHRTVRCHRFSATRVDCENEETDYTGDPPWHCGEVSVAQLAPTGDIYRSDYSCPRHGAPIFRRHPRFRNREWYDYTSYEKAAAAVR